MKYLLIAFITLFCFALFGQDSISLDTSRITPLFDDIPITPESLMDQFNYLYMALIWVWGYIAKAFKLNTKKVPFVFVIVAGAAVIAGLFVAARGTDTNYIGLIFSFLSSLGIYDIVLKQIENAIKKNKPVSEII